MLKVLQNNKFKRTQKADANSIREFTALTAVSNKIFMIAGRDAESKGRYLCYLSTVSCYDIASNTWESLNAKLNSERYYHSACTLNGMIYVFGG